MEKVTSVRKWLVKFFYFLSVMFSTMTFYDSDRSPVLSRKSDVIFTLFLDCPY